MLVQWYPENDVTDLKVQASDISLWYFPLTITHLPPKAMLKSEAHKVHLAWVSPTIKSKELVEGHNF